MLKPAVLHYDRVGDGVVRSGQFLRSYLLVTAIHFSLNMNSTSSRVANFFELLSLLALNSAVVVYYCMLRLRLYYMKLIVSLHILLPSSVETG